MDDAVRCKRFVFNVDLFSILMNKCNNQLNCTHAQNNCESWVKGTDDSVKPNCENHSHDDFALFSWKDTKLKIMRLVFRERKAHGNF